MFDMDCVSTEVQGILSMLDANSFPGVFEYLASLRDEDGDVMYRKSLDAAVKGQANARAKLAEELPECTWSFD
ncbi:MAG: hypothetical protein K6G54_04685 [Oscillospiraceae bacterium]|nr:hypothetical protein [Oscillospiraceae bacterium]